MNLEKVIADINAAAKEYAIGGLQEFRSNNNAHPPRTWNIFVNKPIDPDWTFHDGGRGELQFNIGNEDEGLRYGVAFSLQPSVSLPDPTVLYPNIRRLNYIIKTRPELFSGFSMWLWTADGRSAIMPVHELTEEEVQIPNFIFIGKVQKKYDLKDIMETFDHLFPIYKEVQSATSSAATISSAPAEQDAFVFQKSERSLPKERHGSVAAREINTVVRHSLIQEALLKILEKKYGKDNVQAEHYWHGGRIDVVAKDGAENIFYEIKVANSARNCICDALGQLFDYAYYPNKRHAQKLVIVGEANIDDKTQAYIDFLRSEFHIPLEYMSVSVD